MTDNFESQKNMQAGGYTALVCVLLLVIFLFVKWGLPPAPPPIEEGIEVNLGNSDFGLGDDQAFEPGEPAPQDQQSYVPPQPVTTRNDDAKDFMTDDKDADAPVVKKSPVTKPESQKVPEKEVVKTKATTKPKTETPPAPVPPKPKAEFKGVNGTGTGGNAADNYKKGGNEGIAGGTGDQGRPGGNPDSKNYEGGGKGNGNIIVHKGNRNIISGLDFSFTGDFNRDAVIYADVKVNESGVGTYIRVAKGSTTTDKVYIDEIIRRLRVIKFNKSAEESTITLKFNFRVTR